MKLIGQNIVVTGASKGIGFAIAERLLQHGARVAVHYHSGKKEAEALVSRYGSEKAIGVQANLAHETEVLSLFEEALQFLGHVDSLILNAGVFIPHPITQQTDDWYAIWKKTLSINLDAAGLLTKVALDHFMSRNEGRIIYIGSRAAFRGETEEYLGYAASKGGLTSLGKSVARSFGKFNIKSFVLAPGFTRTAMAEQFMSNYGEEAVLKEIALNELTKVTDIAPLVGFMCTGAMDHATGTTIDLNAGSYIH